MNILTFVDPSPRREWALQLTSELAARLARRVVLLATEEDIAHQPGLLDNAAADIGAPDVVVVEKKVRSGRARRVIVEEARDNPYQITVFPPDGKDRVPSLIGDSRVMWVVRNAPSSVLVARRPVPRIRRILAAVTATPYGQTTIGAALEIARSQQASLTAIHVASTAGSSARVSPPRGSKEKRGIPKMMKRVREEFEKAGREPDILIRDGDVVEAVIYEVDAGAYDLLVIGNHVPVEKGEDRDLSERIVLWSSVPVLVVQPRKP